MGLDILDIKKTYGNGVAALRGINLQIPNGMFGLLGPNGAGKSSLMRTLCTLQEPDSGEIHFDSIDVLKQKQDLRKVLGYLPQDFGVPTKVSAEELLDYFAVLKGITGKDQRREAVTALLAQTNLYEARKRAVSSYSGGMKQRFGIAQALLGNPKLIIVDEPTAGLDPEERNRFHNLLCEIGQNRVVILSTHIVEDVADLCTQMAIMDKGQVLLSGNPRECIRKMEGKIWQKSIAKTELPQYRQKFKVISTRFSMGTMLIRIYSEAPPENGFEPANVDLEDVYFSTLAVVSAD